MITTNTTEIYRQSPKAHTSKNIHGRNTSNDMASFLVEIPMKLPSLNDYVRICRGNYHGANNLKQKLEHDIGLFLRDLPTFESPVTIKFLWVEENKRRDLDNIAFAKKFILDALQKSGKLKNDNRKFVVGFSDDFDYQKEAKVIITITEV